MAHWGPNTDVSRFRVIDVEEYHEDTDDEGRYRFQVVSTEMRGRTQARGEWIEPGQYTAQQKRSLIAKSRDLVDYEGMYKRVTKARLAERADRSAANPYVDSQKMWVRDFGATTVVSIRKQAFVAHKPKKKRREGASGIDPELYKGQCEKHPHCIRGWHHKGFGGHCKIVKKCNTLRKTRVPPTERKVAKEESSGEEEEVDVDGSSDEEESMPLSARAALKKKPPVSANPPVPVLPQVAYIIPPPDLPPTLPPVRGASASWRVPAKKRPPPPVRVPADEQPVEAAPPPRVRSPAPYGLTDADYVGFGRPLEMCVRPANMEAPAAEPPAAPTTEEEGSDDVEDDVEDEAEFELLPVPDVTYQSPTLPGSASSAGSSTQLPGEDMVDFIKRRRNEARARGEPDGCPNYTQESPRETAERKQKERERAWSQRPGFHN